MLTSGSPVCVEVLVRLVFCLRLPRLARPYKRTPTQSCTACLLNCYFDPLVEKMHFINDQQEKLGESTRRMDDSP